MWIVFQCRYNWLFPCILHLSDRYRFKFCILHVSMFDKTFYLFKDKLHVDHNQIETLERVYILGMHATVLKQSTALKCRPSIIVSSSIISGGFSCVIWRGTHSTRRKAVPLDAFWANAFAHDTGQCIIQFSITFNAILFDIQFIQMLE